MMAAAMAVAMAVAMLGTMVQCVTVMGDSVGLWPPMGSMCVAAEFSNMTVTVTGCRASPPCGRI